MLLHILLFYIALPAFLIGLVVNRFFGFIAAAWVWTSLVFGGYVLMMYVAAYLVFYGWGDTRGGNFFMGVTVGPFVLWFGGKAYNNIMSFFWQRKQKELEAQRAAEERAQPQYPNTRAPEPY